MKIIILGAGQVGSTLAKSLLGENNDITLVDIDINHLYPFQDKDLRVVQGNGAHPRVLEEADARDADMLVAVTSSDEINITACQIAYLLFNMPNRIARIRSIEYVCQADRLFQSAAIPIDWIAPEQLVIDYIYRLIQYPGALQTVNFARGKVSVVVAKAYYGGALVGNKIAFLQQHLPHIETRILALFRQNQFIQPTESTVIEAGDEVFFIVAAQHIRTVIGELQPLEKRYKSIMIAGGGNIGAGLAKKLEKKCQIKLIERNKKRATELAKMLDKAIVYCGNASDQDLLKDEHIDQVGLFISVTNNDEVNIMAAMLAKFHGAQKTMVLIKHAPYVDLVQDEKIDIVISPEQATISALLSRIRKADVINVSSLRRGVTEAIEAVVHGDEKTSKVVGRRLKQIKLPPGTLIGALVRGNEVLIANETNNPILAHGDHVIIFIAEKKHIPEIERLFQPSPFFL